MPSQPSRRSRLLLSAGRPPPYAMTAMRRAHGLPPGVFTVDIFHDDDCGLLRRGGPCTCSPSVGQPRPA